MYSKISARASARVEKSAPCTSSFFSYAKKPSIGALSQQSALRLMLQVIPAGPAAPGSARWRTGCRTLSGKALAVAAATLLAIGLAVYFQLLRPTTYRDITGSPGKWSGQSGGLTL